MQRGKDGVNAEYSRKSDYAHGMGGGREQTQSSSKKGNGKLMNRAVPSKELRDYYDSSSDEEEEESSNTSSTIASTDESDDQNGGKYESSSDESSVGSGFLKDGLPNIVINGDAEGGAVNMGDEKRKKKKKKKRKKDKERK